MANNDRFVEIDHRLGCANMHHTRVDELNGLCSQCHALKDHRGLTLVRGGAGGSWCLAGTATTPEIRRRHTGGPETRRV